MPIGRKEDIMKERVKLKHLLEGIWLGMTFLAPGLSMATVAMVLGIYEQLLDLVDNFFSSKWKETLKVLIPLGIGAIVAIIVSSQLITLAMEHFPTQTDFLFIGFVVGAIPLLLNTANAKTNFRQKHLILLGIVAILVASFRLFEIDQAEQAMGSLDMLSIVRLGITGALASTAMLLPGLSAALMLMLMGTYDMLIHSLSTFNLPVIIIVIIGAIIGLIVTSKGVKYLLKNHLDFTNAASIGMVVGSIIVIYPGFSWNVLEIVTSILTFSIGFIGVMLINRQKVMESAYETDENTPNK